MYLDNHTTSCGFSTIDKLCDDCVDGEEVEEDEEGTNMTFKQCQILLKHTQLMKLFELGIAAVSSKTYGFN